MCVLDDRKCRMTVQWLQGQHEHLNLLRNPPLKLAVTVVYVCFCDCVCFHASPPSSLPTEMRCSKYKGHSVGRQTGGSRQNQPGTVTSIYLCVCMDEQHVY